MCYEVGQLVTLCDDVADNCATRQTSGATLTSCVRALVTTSPATMVALAGNALSEKGAAQMSVACWANVGVNAPSKMALFDRS